MSDAVKELREKLFYEKKNGLLKADEATLDSMQKYCEGYKSYLDAAKTEREAVATAIAMAEKSGFVPFVIGNKYNAGDRVYFNNRGKTVAFAVIGKESADKGINITAAHVDSPRLDLKPNPLYEASELSYLKTHYYGGIKKYQWTATPLALHGVVVKADGEVVDIKIGEDDSDPVFYINDLLPHLGQRQAQEPLGSAISGETLNILVGGLPYKDDEISEKIKLTVLSILNDKYGIVEEDFISAELSLVPAAKARDIGFDRALIGAYGHDDRVCSYPALTALFDTATDRSVMVVLADKEEIGSDGLTGMQCDILVDLIVKISEAKNADSIVVRSKSKCLSADVTAAYDPNFAEVYEKRNSAFVSCGTCMSKFTGSRGKSGTNDASAEYVGFIRRLFTENNVIWQTAELGKVDAGGGGTVAKYISKHNIETVDIGVPVISMHAPYEVVSKADVYSTYKAFCAFIK